MIAARNLCAAVARKSIIVSQDRMNGAWLRASLLGLAQGLNKAPLCTNIEALFVEMDFLRPQGHSQITTTLDIYTIPIPAHQRAAVENLSRMVTNGDEFGADAESGITHSDMLQ